MSILAAVLLGLIQGIAEFLPISSSGHLSILQNLFGVNTAEGHMLFDVLLHFGTLISVCVVYRRDIVDMVREFIGMLGDIKNPGSGREASVPTRRLIIMIIVSTLPLLAVMLVKDYIEQLYYSTAFVGFGLILTGCMLYVSDKMISGRKNEKTMTVKDALIIGLCQAVATIPGISRSGATITAGIATGQNREFAVRYSFLISLPAIVGACILSIIDAVKAGSDVAFLAYALGAAVAAVVGIFAIKLVNALAQKGKFGMFAVYCWAVGGLSILLSIIL